MKPPALALKVCLIPTVLGLATLVIGPSNGSAKAATQQPQPLCTAEDPVDFICPYEYSPTNPNSKWRSITVTSSAVSSGGNCTNHCTFSYSVSMTAKPGTYGTYDVTSGGTSGTTTFSASQQSHTFSNSSLSVPCGGSALFDVSYQKGNCPTSCPDGPGACSVVAITFICGPNC